MSAPKVTEKTWLSQVDLKTDMPGVYKRGSSYRVLIRPDGHRKVMKRFDSYEEAVAFKLLMPRRERDRPPDRERAARPRQRVGAVQSPRTEWSNRTTKVFLDHLRQDPCAYCGAPSEAIDHIVPVVGGGPNEWHNYTAACQPCNSRKRDRSLLIFLASEHGCWRWQCAAT